jgi:hypothetical protein
MYRIVGRREKDRRRYNGYFRGCDAKREPGIDSGHRPVPMMKPVSDIFRSLQIRTIVNLNPIMIDGTCMCGSCRIEVGKDEAGLRGRAGIRRGTR